MNLSENIFRFKNYEFTDEQEDIPNNIKQNTQVRNCAKVTCDNKKGITKFSTKQSPHNIFALCPSFQYGGFCFLIQD